MLIRKFASVVAVLSAVACGGGYEGNYEPSFAPSAPVAPTAPAVEETPSAPTEKSLPISYSKPSGFTRVDDNDIMLLLSRASDGAKIAVNPFPGLTPMGVTVAASLTAIKKGCVAGGEIVPMNGVSDTYFVLFSCGNGVITIVGQNIGGTSYLTMGNWPNASGEDATVVRKFTLSLRPNSAY